MYIVYPIHVIKYNSANKRNILLLNWSMLFYGKTKCVIANKRRKLKGVAKIKPKMCCCSVHVYVFDSTINHWNVFSLASAWQLLYMLNVRLIPDQVWPLLQFQWMFQKGLFFLILHWCFVETSVVCIYVNIYIHARKYTDMCT